MNFVNRIQANVLSACSSFKTGGGCAGGQYYTALGGTSMASTHVVSGVALITSRPTATTNLARTQAVECCLLATGDPITLPNTPSRPRLNALDAATAAYTGL